MHGTTVATNALLERKGARVGLLTTEGHRDVIEMREGLKDDRYNLRMAPPVPLVPRARRLGVRERMRFDGTVATPLGARSLETAITALEKARVEAVAVCYLHSYRNPRHESLTGRALARRLPGAYVSLSSEVLPQIKEYERVWTTVVNAYVGPGLSRYLASLAARSWTWAPNCAGFTAASTRRHSTARWPRTPSTLVQKMSARSWRTRRLSVTRVRPPVPGSTPSSGTSGSDTDDERSSTSTISSQASASS